MTDVFATRSPQHTPPQSPYRIPPHTPPQDPYRTQPAAQHTPQPAPQRRSPSSRGPLVAGVAGATALVLAGTVGAASLVSVTADDVLAALGDAPAATAPVEGPAAAGEDTRDVPAAADPADGVDWGAVAADVQQAVVAIQVRGADGTGGEGSGVVFDDAAHVITNNHVVAGAVNGGQVRVSLSDGRVLDAEIVGTDPSTDLAVLALVDAPDDLVPAELGRSADVRVGDPVMAVGNPLGLSGTVTTGIVSALDRPVTTQAAGVAAGEPVVTSAIQTDAAVNPGNSGGPLFDREGRVVGINSSIASLGGAGGAVGSIGLGFAIPVDQAAAVAEQLVADGTAEHARLGVYLEDAGAEVVSGEWEGRRLGAGLADIIPGSAAEAAGLRSGDVVIALDGRTISSSESLTARVRGLQPGDTATVVVERDGEAVEVEVTVDAAEA